MTLDGLCVADAQTGGGTSLFFRESVASARRLPNYGKSRKYTTLIKQLRFENLSKSLPIVNMKMSSPDSDLAHKL